jgi:hypothetical protein
MQSIAGVTMALVGTLLNVNLFYLDGDNHFFNANLVWLILISLLMRFRFLLSISINVYM